MLVAPSGREESYVLLPPLFFGHFVVGLFDSRNYRPMSYGGNVSGNVEKTKNKRQKIEKRLKRTGKFKFKWHRYIRG
jgi:hypothetical protein